MSVKAELEDDARVAAAPIAPTPGQSQRAPASDAAAPDSRCHACGCHLPGGSLAASLGGTTPTCSLCESLEAMCAANSGIDGAIRLPRPGDPSWVALGNLYAALADKMPRGVPYGVLEAAWFHSRVYVKEEDPPAHASAETPAASALSTAAASSSSTPEPEASSTLALPRFASRDPTASAPTASASSQGVSGGRASTFGRINLSLAAGPSAAVAESTPEPQDEDVAAATVLPDGPQLLDAMPINRFALTAKLPTGNTLYLSFARIRKTINEYTNKVENTSWLADFNLGTAQALARRFDAHQSSIVGKSFVDLEIAYNQLRSRLNCLLKLYGEFKTWASTQSDDNLAYLMDYKPVVSEYLNLFGKDWAPNLMLAFMYGSFIRDRAAGAPLHEIVDKLDFVKVCQWHESMMQVPPIAEAVEATADTTEAADPKDDEVVKKAKREKLKKRNLAPALALDRQWCHHPHLSSSVLVSCGHRTPFGWCAGRPCLFDSPSKVRGSM